MLGDGGFVGCGKSVQAKRLINAAVIFVLPTGMFAGEKSFGDRVSRFVGGGGRSNFGWRRESLQGSASAWLVVKPVEVHVVVWRDVSLERLLSVLDY